MAVGVVPQCESEEERRCYKRTAREQAFPLELLAQFLEEKVGIAHASRTLSHTRMITYNGAYGQVRG